MAGLKHVMFTNMYIPCTSANSVSLQSFACLSSEIRVFNLKKSEKGFFHSDTFSMVKMDPFLPNLAFDGIVAMMSLEVQMTAY